MTVYSDGLDRKERERYLKDIELLVEIKAHPNVLDTYFHLRGYSSKRNKIPRSTLWRHKKVLKKAGIKI